MKKHDMKFPFKVFLTLLASMMALQAAAWQPDILGDGYEMEYIDQPADYSGPVRSTLVRLQSACATDAAVLYVPGFNDYFFNAEMGREFAAHCYDFYAVDLRKYGRSILPGQRLFEARDLREYFADIDSALVRMQADGVREVVLMGHSTGGLITAYYLSQNPNPLVRALVLNSPFLDWNQSKFQEKFLIPVVDTFAPLMPKVEIPQGDSDVYARSLLRQFGGEWTYDTDWKLIHSPAVETSWIRAIDSAQAVVQDFPNILVPILLMHSDRSSADPSASDMVLDVEDISRYGRRLGPEVTEITVRGGLHDLVLSAPAVRKPLYTYIFAWLGNKCPSH